MKKNSIYSVLVIVLGIFTCIIAINPSMTGNSPDYGNEENDMDVMNNDDIKTDIGMSEFTEKNPVAGQVIELEAKDIDGNGINNSIFEEQGLTLINLWSINCGPCVQEIPELEKIANEYKGKVRVIGINVDEDVESVKEVIKDKNVTYTNIILDSKLEEQIMKYFDYIPVTLVVNNEGKILEQFIPGGGDYNLFKSFMEELLDK